MNRYETNFFYGDNGYKSKTHQALVFTNKSAHRLSLVLESDGF